MKRIVTAAAVLAVSVAAAVASAAQSPSALRGSMLAAARAGHSVHCASKTVAGNSLLSLTADVGSTDGVQHFKLEAGKATGHLTIDVVNQTAYVNGDAVGLQYIQGLTKAEATQYAGQWISIPLLDKDYAATAAGVTLASFVKELTPHGKLTAHSGKISGKRLNVVRGVAGKGKKKVLEVLAAPVQGKPLPRYAERLAPGLSLASVTKLSKWGERVKVTAPSSSVPISTVRTS